MKKLVLVFSEISNRILAGYSKMDMKGNLQVFSGTKTDVTDSALHAVAHYLVKSDNIKIFTLPDGREIDLRADIKSLTGLKDDTQAARTIVQNTNVIIEHKAY